MRGRGAALATALVLVAALLAVRVGAAAEDAAVQSYPSRPIRWIVPYTPGGITDSVTRLVTARLQQTLGQPIVIDNRPGANSIIGSEVVAHADPDGYSLLAVVAAYATNATMYAGKLPYDTTASFAPISLVGISPFILTVSPELPVKDVKGLIEYAKQNPGRLAFGSSGIGAGAHLTTELFAETAGIEMVHVPYKGSGPALQGLLSGDIQVLVDTPLTTLAQVRSGRAHALGLFAAKRSSGAPDVPTLEEAGGPALESSTWVMFLAPARTPRAIVDKLSAATAQALAAPDLRAKLEELGVDGIGGTPEQASQFLAAEIVRWAKVIQTAHVEAEPF